MMRFVLAVALAIGAWAAPAAARVVVCCAEGNDLYVALGGAKAVGVERVETPAEAVRRAPEGGGVLVLAEGYPGERTAVDEGFFAEAERKRLKVYVEFPSGVPGVELGAARRAEWERVVVGTEAFGASLGKLRILNAHACTFLPAKGVEGAPLVIARVAGFDTAVYGLPKEKWPVLFAAREGRWLVGTTKLSNVVTGRYGPVEDWGAVWRFILNHVDPAGEAARGLVWRADVRPAYGKGERLPEGAEAAASRAAAEWYLNAGLLVDEAGEGEVHRLLAKGAEALPVGSAGMKGDGSRGIIEGFGSAIHPDGSQPRRIPIRSDCNAESAMVLALEGWRAGGDGFARGRAVAGNLLDYAYFRAPSWRGPRGDPGHPAFGLIAWGEVAPAWVVGNYGDDNARAILATVAAAAAMGSDRYDRAVLRALMANLRTTGRMGFRGDRVDVPQLEKLGWRHFHDARTVNPSPHFESGLWACYLWAYARTGEKEFLETARRGIAATMAVYPKGWRWKDNLERARMLLCLAWMVRVEDTPEHRGWLMAVAGDLLKSQQKSGAIRERIVGIRDGGHYSVPVSNEAYGTTETPLQQTPEDPVTDQLYTSGFALLGLHEGAAATGDAGLKEAADGLAEYLCRIQVRSERRAELNGAWMRAFDDEAWEFRASSADVGWGAWCVEAGWGQAWGAAVLAMRGKGTTLWEMTSGSEIAKEVGVVKGEMGRNEGGPWKR